MIALELLDEARAQIDAGDLAAAREYIESASANTILASHEARLNEVLAAVNAAEADADQLWKWRALLSYGVGNHGGTRDQLRLLELLKTAPAHDKKAPLASKARTNFFAWITTHRAEITRLQKSIVNQLENK
jgi:hypothetical protein